MNRLILLGLILVSIIHCKSNEEKRQTKTINCLQTIETKKSKPIELEIEKKDSKNEQSILPIHGKLSQENLHKYYPKITDTIRDLRIIGSEKIDLNPGNKITVSILHNTGTFDQMIVCTHDKNFGLIDHLYIGKATAFDNDKSHTIEFFIKNKKEIIFLQTDWGYSGEEIVPIKKEEMIITLNEKGQIEHRKVIFNN
ncbi:hypothetical protein [Flavobacterium sp. 9AF]|uniref:hypothetical protein n=1 Tax=Flavobacterium sp. 9AF TaxID=2653142 RepID=UPI001358EC4C|nr:hypothetical protein [Flavobacterium sp. 9AF]